MTAGQAQTLGSCATGNWRLGLEINRGTLCGLRYYKIAREALRKGLRRCRIRPQQSHTTAGRRRVAMRCPAVLPSSRGERLRGRRHDMHGRTGDGLRQRWARAGVSLLERA